MEDLGGEWIVRDVEEIKDDKGTREHHTRHGVEEGTARPIEVLSK